MKNKLLLPSLLGLALTSALAPMAHSQSVKLDAEDNRVIAELDKILHKRVKTADGGKVNIRIVPTDRASEGYFSEISISGTNAKVKKLYISEVSLNAKNVQIDVPALFNERKVNTLKATTSMRVVITDTDLTRMLAEGKNTADMKLNVKYAGDRMNVTGNLNYMLLKGPVDGSAKLRQGGDHKLFLDILSMKLRGTEIPGFMKNQFSNHINPVIDYKDLPFNPPFKTLKVVGNKAIISTS